MEKTDSTILNHGICCVSWVMIIFVVDSYYYFARNYMDISFD